MTQKLNTQVNLEDLIAGLANVGINVRSPHQQMQEEERGGPASTAAPNTVPASDTNTPATTTAAAAAPTTTTAAAAAPTTTTTANAAATAQPTITQATANANEATRTPSIDPEVLAHVLRALGIDIGEVLQLPSPPQPSRTLALGPPGARSPSTLPSHPPVVEGGRRSWRLRLTLLESRPPPKGRLLLLVLARRPPRATVFSSPVLTPPASSAPRAMSGTSARPLSPTMSSPLAWTLASLLTGTSCPLLSPASVAPCSRSIALTRLLRRSSTKPSLRVESAVFLLRRQVKDIKWVGYITSYTHPLLAIAPAAGLMYLSKPVACCHVLDCSVSLL